MRIATWNVNGLRARLDFILHWLRSRTPDVVGMQELKATDDEFPHSAFEALGYQVETHGQKGWNGVAIASKAPVEVERRGLPGHEADGARLIQARTEEGLTFATVYCPNGKALDHADFPKKLAWYDGLIDHLGGELGESFVLGGDFNIVPKPLDCWRGEAADGTIFCTEQERQRYQRLLDLGLADLYRQLHPDEQCFSWWDYRGGAFHRGMGLRIDMLLGTAAVAKRVSNVTVDREYRYKKDGLIASDHAPVYADLD